MSYFKNEIIITFRNTFCALRSVILPVAWTELKTVAPEPNEAEHKKTALEETSHLKCSMLLDLDPYSYLSAPQ